jgi:phospholipid/cholesterol/gamma-HCH transport system substrate-binding protein
MSDARQRRGSRVPSWLIGLVLLVVLALATLYAFTKQVPWHSAYEVRAVFSSAQNLRPSSPVRIAGVNVGEVTQVEPVTSTDADGDEAAIVTMELEDEARPVREDATLKLRPRLFLEGNYFVDLQPGSPNAAEVEDGHTFPVNQTAYSVQLDQVLTTLQADVRANLQVLLNQLGNGLIKHGGAEGFRELYRTSPASYKFTSQVNEALLGTEPHDLSGWIRGLDRVVRGLGRNEGALQGLVTNLRIFSGSFAAEDVALGRAIDELPDTLASARPAFANLNRSFPALRAFAREALPGARSAPETLDAALPFVEQVRALVSERELRGLVADLRPTIPELAALSERSIGFMDQVRRLSSCFNEVVIPWSNDSIYATGTLPGGGLYPHPAPETDDGPATVYEETGYGLAGVAGESRTGDANGQFIRVAAGGGPNTVVIPPSGLPGDTDGETAFGVTSSRLLGSAPSILDSAKTPFRRNVRCETQEPPDLGATIGPAPQQQTSATAAPDELGGPLGDMVREALRILREDAGSEDELARSWLRLVERDLPRYQERIQAQVAGGAG